MLGLLILFSFWVAMTIIIILPLVLAFIISDFLKGKLGLEGFEHLMVLVIVYIIIVCLLILI